MEKIGNIIDAIRSCRIRSDDHADEEAQNDILSYEEICSSLFTGEIVEDYPRDKLYPSLRRKRLKSYYERESK